MEKIDEKEIARRFEAISKFKTSEEVVTRDLKRVSHMLTEPRSRPTRGQNIWRTILQSQLTKLAAAAVVVIAAVVALHNGSVQITTPAFGVQDVLDAMNEAQWVHCVGEITHLNVDANTAKEMDLSGVESWESVRPLRRIEKHKNGKIYFTESNIGKTSYYDPATNKITIKYRSPADPQEAYASIADMYIRQFAELEMKGAKINYEDGVCDGVSVKIMNLDFTSGEGINTNISMVLDPATYLPKRLIADQRDSKGLHARMSAQFDYPETGPKDIFEAGAPRDAKVVVIDNRPDPEFLEVMKSYDAARGNLSEQRIEVVIWSWDGGKRCMIDVFYIDGRRERHENRHWVDESVNRIPASEGFGAVLNWARTVRCDHVAVKIYDGEYMYSADCDSAGDCKVAEKEYAPELPPSIAGLIAHGWPMMARGKVIQNDHAAREKLICIEYLDGSLVKDGRLMHPASRRLSYLEPERDYMCVRRESYRHRVSPPRDGPVKIDEIDFDPDTTPLEPSNIKEVMEFGRLDSGQWYPKKIKQQSIAWRCGTEPVPDIGIVTVYIQTKPEFPEGIFDPENLLKGSE